MRAPARAAMDYTRLGIFAAILLRAAPRLFLLGTGPVVWGLAVLLCGAFDAFRYLATGVVGRSFGTLPLVWGYGVFDAVMGIPMAGGALIGGLLYRESYGSPFLMTIAFCAMLIVGLAFGGRRAATATSTGGRHGIP